MYSKEGIRQIIKQKVQSIKVPYQRIAFREDKWGLLATVYFWGIGRPISFDRYDIESEDSWESVKHSIITGSNKAKLEFGLRYSKDATKYVKGVNIEYL